MHLDDEAIRETEEADAAGRDQLDLSQQEALTAAEIRRLEVLLFSTLEPPTQEH